MDATKDMKAEAYITNIEVYADKEHIATLELFESTWDVRLVRSLLSSEELRIIADAIDSANKLLGCILNKGDSRES